MATDIGIELGIAFDILRGREHESDAAHNRSKLRLHLFTISAFLLGGVAGVVLYRAIECRLFIVAAMTLFVIAMLGISQARRTSGRVGAAIAEEDSIET